MILAEDENVAKLCETDNCKVVNSRKEYAQFLLQNPCANVFSSHRTVFVDQQYSTQIKASIFRGVPIEGQFIRILNRNQSSKEVFSSVRTSAELFRKPDTTWVTPSSSASTKLSNLLGGPVSVVFNGIEVCAKRSKRLKRLNNELNCIVVSRLVDWKNIDWLMCVTKELPCRLKIFGEGPLNSYLKEKIAEKEFRHVRLMGHISNMNEIYSNADLLLHAAKHEAFGRVAIEAASFGVPSLVAKGTGISELVRGGQTGELFQLDDESDFSAKFERIRSAYELNSDTYFESCIRWAHNFDPSYSALGVLNLVERLDA